MFILCFLQNIKLSSIKVDTRYTTTQQVVKLIGSHTISKVTVKIGDLKRTKMVRTINLYYNNRTVQAIVELKNKYVSKKICRPFLPSFIFHSCVHNSYLKVKFKNTKYIYWSQFHFDSFACMK